jgi:hypothetical protein
MFRGFKVDLYRCGLSGISCAGHHLGGNGRVRIGHDLPSRLEGSPDIERFTAMLPTIAHVIAWPGRRQKPSFRVSILHSCSNGCTR